MDVLDDTLYNDDFLARTLHTTTLYEKPSLNLSFIGNNNNEGKHSQRMEDVTPDSPDLDFLKFGSPDLEQMFLSIEEDDETSLSNEDDVASATFNIEEDLVSAENCFTEALQHLHDKNESLPVDLLDITFKPPRSESEVRLNATPKQCKALSSPETNELTKSPQSNGNNNNNNNNNSHDDNNTTATTTCPANTNHPLAKQPVQSLSAIRQRMYHTDALNNNQQIPSKGLHHHDRPSMVAPPQHHMPPLTAADIILPEEIAINNQLALINSMNQSMGAHQLHHHQQELAFLTQAMGYQTNRESIQSHMSMNGGYPTHINQMPSHMQQKFIEQQMLHQQMTGGFHGSENNPQLSNMAHIDSVGIDDQTLKMFVENPHLAPLNLDIQELIKRERKKLRNRIASSKCRKRKLEREGRLEDKVKTLKEKNIELNAVANALKQQICDLKQRVMEHVGEGCQIVLPS